MHAIYFDLNEGDANGRYDLGIPGSAAGLARAGADLFNGVRVRLYMEEVRVEAILEWDAETSRWWAVPDWDTLRHLDDTIARPEAAE